jgi:hypothetical protein
VQQTIEEVDIVSADFIAGFESLFCLPIVRVLQNRDWNFQAQRVMKRHQQGYYAGD